MSVFKYFTPSYWRDRRKMRDLRTISSAIAIVREMQKKGLLSWNARDRQLLIEESVATVFLHEREWWEGFMKSVLHTVMEDRRQEAYEMAVHDAEGRAIRKAKRDNPRHPLTRADIQRIRQNARENMEPLADDIIEEFDIFIIRSTATATHAATEATGELVAVGHYHIDGQIDLAMWDDVRHNFSQF